MRKEPRSGHRRRHGSFLGDRLGERAPSVIDGTEGRCCDPVP